MLREFDTSRKRVAIAATILALTSALTACGGRSEETGVPGITDETVTIGSSVPRSGPASAYAAVSDGIEAYLDKVNGDGGAEMGDGKTREVKYITYDDAYTPDKVVANVRRLVTQDKVFAISAIIGTPTNVAVRDYLNANEVPQVFSGSPSSLWGDKEKYPWTRGLQPTYGTEATVYADYLKREHPDATVAILSQNDDYGAEFVENFTDAISGSEVKIVAHETYEVTDPSVNTQITKLAESGASVFLDISTTKASAQAVRKHGELNWDSIHILNNHSASIPAVLEPAGLDNAKGLISATFTMDAANPKWADNPAMIAYEEEVSGAGLNPDDPLVLLGWTIGEAIVDALGRTEEPTREAFMDAIDSYQDFAPELLLPGVAINTSEDDPFLVESMYLQQFNGTQWDQIGDLVSVEGKSEVFGR